MIRTATGLGVVFACLAGLQPSSSPTAGLPYLGPSIALAGNGSDRGGSGSNAGDSAGGSGGDQGGAEAGDDDDDTAGDDDDDDDAAGDDDDDDDAAGDDDDDDDTAGDDDDDDDDTGTSVADASPVADSSVEPARPSASRGDIVPNEVLIALDRRTALPSDLESIGFRIVESRDLPALDLTVTRLRPPVGLDPETARSILARRYPDLLVDVHGLYHAAAAGEVLAAPDSALRQIAWSSALTACAGPVSVGMIDTAIDPATRQGIGSRLVVGTFAEAGGPTDHGGMIASLLAGGRPGPVPVLLPSARLYAADVFGPAGAEPLGSVVAVAEALDWLVAQGVPVAGVSLEGAPNRVLALAVARAADSGLVVVAAAGNEGPDAPPSYPAALPDVIAVSAVDGLGQAYVGGNRGDYVDLAAPGVGLWINDGSGGGRRVTGTSFAVPFVAAVLAVEAERTRLDPATALTLLKSRAQDLGPSGWDPIFGAGLVRAPDGC